MQLYVTLLTVFSALGLMILFALFPFEFLSKDNDKHRDNMAAAIEVRVKQSQLMQSLMNTSADPCVNFYEYACGNWEEVNPIPKDKWRYSSMHLLIDKVDTKLKEVLQEPTRNDEAPNAADKAKIFYRSCTDEGTIEKRGAQPLLNFIEKLGGWPVMIEDWNETNFDWIQLAINLSFVRNGVILAHDVEKDTRTSENIIFLKQPILGMDNIDYYLLEEHANKLEAYTNLVKTVLLLLGVNEYVAQNASKEIVKFETRLADAKNTPRKLKTKLLLRLSLSKVEDRYDEIEWDRYLSSVHGTKIGKNQTVGVVYGAADWYYINLCGILSDVNPRILANYMIWRGVLFVLPTLSADFRNALNNFNEILTGQEDPQPLWNRCVKQVNSNIGMAASALFVKKYFDESSKEVASDIINSLKIVFEENLSDLDWLGEDTKEYAIKKVHNMTASVGYPEFILSEDILNHLHNTVHVVDGEHFENFISIAKFHRQENMNKLFKPFNPDLWLKPPTMVNALYSAAANEIIVLAGILQPPTFHQYFPQSLNYGKIGMFLGHEIIHGFDNNGRRIGIDGNVANWWSDSESFAFEDKKKCFEEQYENLSNLDIPFDAVLTISENLADNGGVRLAYKAYLKWTDENRHPKRTMVETLPNLDLDEHQLFFLGFAQAFCEAIRPEAIQANKHETHSPPKYRTIGSLMNFKKFSEAFHCPEGSPMNPSKKCRIW